MVVRLELDWKAKSLAAFSFVMSLDREDIVEKVLLTEVEGKMVMTGNELVVGYVLDNINDVVGVLQLVVDVVGIDNGGTQLTLDVDKSGWVVIVTGIVSLVWTFACEIVLEVTATKVGLELEERTGVELAVEAGVCVDCKNRRTHFYVACTSSHICQGRSLLALL